MKRVKDVTKLILKPNEVLTEVFLKKSLIIKPNDKNKESEIDYAVILAKGKDVEEYNINDIVLLANGGFTFEVEKDGVNRVYSVYQKHSIVLAVTPDNVDLKDSKNYKLFN